MDLPIFKVREFKSPRCVVCNETLSAESMKPSKLKRHLETRHPEYSSKDPSFFIRMEILLKRSRLDTTGTYQQQSFTCIEASYLVSLRIARKYKPHTIGEDRILPCAKDMVQLIFGNEFAKRYHAPSF
ncbi:SCAN domain-containing protein 3 isoform X1 [Oopsacas minuta]|uniref:SCAN domain-containing protein 3 isoform X1 n=1 Tax=Oopsacas minuta TaxID=111878 RepID=A0AAV7JT30_9METZ|nr:SCAN domain-containing protein 3 isoform X1 [Oopsacas minuta]